MKPPEGVLAAIRGAERIAVVCHEEPDPDAIGSLLGLSLGLERTGRQVAAITPDPPPPRLGFLPGFERLLTPGQVVDAYPLVVVVDTDPGRVGEARRLLEGAKVVVNIDHHSTNPGGGPYSWIVPEAAACGLLIESLLRGLGAEPDPEIATCLYAAIAGDTGSFQFSNTTPEVLEAASRLVERGARPHEIARALFHSRPLGYLRLLRDVLDTLELSPDGRVAWITLRRGAFHAHGLTGPESDGLIQYPRMVEGVEVALLFREDDGRVKVSLRSNERVDVARIAHGFGGGGHPRAAGFWMEGELEGVRERVVAAVARAVGG